MLRFLDYFVSKDPAQKLREKYDNFRGLLSENNAVLEIMADMEEKVSIEYLFDMAYLTSNYSELSGRVKIIIDKLNALGEGKYKELNDAFNRIDLDLRGVIDGKSRIPVADFTISFDRITKEMTDIVGAKNGHLGEVRNKAGITVPDGFAISTHAYIKFLEADGLHQRITHQLALLNPRDKSSLRNVTEKIRAMIVETELPREIAQEILGAYHDLVRKNGCDAVSVRSSAVFEDGESSFAGQYSTVLGVTEAHLLQSYKEVVSSKFTPRTLVYSQNQGISETETAMAVGCLEMIEAKTAGVMYSQDPNDVKNNKMIITAVWGMGKYAVDGTVTPDIYVASKPGGETLEQKISPKPVMLVCSNGGVNKREVPLGMQSAPCLTEEQIQCLSKIGARIEEYYGRPQDMEWALDKRDKLYVLQARPLRVAKRKEPRKRVINPGHKILIDGGTTASGGVAFGKVYRIATDDDLDKVPADAILVARTPSPRLVAAMDRVVGIVTDLGSAAGHMAVVARELQIPTIVNAQSATRALSAGEEVTLDATFVRIYGGRVQELLGIQEDGRKEESLLKQTRIFRTAQAMLRKVVPLHLTDPWSKNFKPKSCHTLHDITRFCHEMSMREMFDFNNQSGSNGGMAKRLVSDIPLSMYVIDLGGGLEKAASHQKDVRSEDITSVPMKALLKGMGHERIRWAGYVPINMKSFISVFANTVCDPAKGERALGEKTYIMLSDNYVNFNSRLGYHFSTIDAYCSDTKNDNYISFRFKGGAASIDKRERRAIFIGRVLRQLEFSVEQKGDFVIATLRKYDRGLLEERLDLLGRLIGCIRQLDVTMHTDGLIDYYVKEFMKGNYSPGIG
ncbi:MAG: PEP/pyruvate-binding domain-containing protein [Pseudomonadota bacterium]